MQTVATVASLSALRQRIRQLEAPVRHGTLPFGVAAIDRALPGGGLALGAVHEILGAGGDEEDGAAAAGFAAGILARLGGSPTSPSHRRAMGPSLSPLQGGEGRSARRNASLSARGGGEGPHPNPPPLAGEGREGVGGGGGEGWGEVGASRTLGSGAVLWCQKQADLYGPGLLAHGLDPARLVLVRAARDEDIVWAVEEGLRASGLEAVVGEVGRLSMVAGRRLQLAAERSGVPALLLRRWRNAAEAAAERERPSAALSRWRVAALPALDIAGEPGIGRPRWRVELLRVRGGAPALWDVEVADATGHVSLSAELADRPAAAARPNSQRAEPQLRRVG